VLVALDVCDRVAAALAWLDVPARELKHVLDGLKQHLVLFVEEDDGGAGLHGSLNPPARKANGFEGRCLFAMMRAVYSLKTRQRV